MQMPSFCWSRWDWRRMEITVHARQMGICLPILQYLVGVSLTLTSTEHAKAFSPHQSLLFTRGSSSNIAGNHGRQTALEERGDAKLHSLSPRMHMSRRQGARGKELCTFLFLLDGIQPLQRSSRPFSPLARTTMQRSMGGWASSSLALGCLVAEAAPLARGSGSARRGRIAAGVQRCAAGLSSSGARTRVVAISRESRTTVHPPSPTNQRRRALAEIVRWWLRRCGTLLLRRFEHLRADDVALNLCEPTGMADPASSKSTTPAEEPEAERQGGGRAVQAWRAGATGPPPWHVVSLHEPLAPSVHDARRGGRGPSRRVGASRR
jgi:hypothetical protein